MLYRLFTEKPQRYLFGLFILLSLLSLPLTEKTISFQLHDTYIVMPVWQQVGVVLLLLALSASLYWTIRHRPKVNWMTIFHLVVLSLFAIAAIALGYNNMIPPRSNVLVLGMLLLILLFVIAKLLFIINLIKAWWRYAK